VSNTLISGIILAGVGSAVPSTCLDNHQLSQVVETSNEWISSRTGIRKRYICATHNCSLTTLAIQAAKEALTMAELTPNEVELIILATSTPEDLFGSASEVQACLGASKAVAFDITAACSGFIFGLVTGAQFISNGAYRNVLIIGADILSRWVDWSDRSTCVLFGDGAGALLLKASLRFLKRGTFRFAKALTIF
jgi:3-oxoacyl-[acyl-carrier-protein] synthase III